MNPKPAARATLALAAGLATLATLLSGCAHAPAYAVVSAPEDRARVVVALPEGGLSHAIVLDESRRLGVLGAGEWMSGDLTPGHHTLFAYAADDADCLASDAKVNPCPSVGVLHARVTAGKVYFTSIERLGSSHWPDVVRVELLRADAASIGATRERPAAVAVHDGLDQSAIRAGLGRRHSDGDWDPRHSSLDPFHGEAAPRDPTWTSGTFPF